MQVSREYMAVIEEGRAAPRGDCKPVGVLRKRAINQSEKYNSLAGYA